MTLKCRILSPWCDAWLVCQSVTGRGTCRHTGKFRPKQDKVAAFLGYEARCRVSGPDCDRQMGLDNAVVRILVEFVGKTRRQITFTAVAAGDYGLVNSEPRKIDVFPPINNDRFWCVDIPIRALGGERRFGSSVSVTMQLDASRRTAACTIPLTSPDASVASTYETSEHNKEEDMVLMNKMMALKKLLRKQYAMLYAAREDLALARGEVDATRIRIGVIEPAAEQIANTEAELANLLKVAIDLDSSDEESLRVLAAELEDALVSLEEVCAGKPASVPVADLRARMSREPGQKAKLKIACDLVPGLLKVELETGFGFLSKAWGRVKSWVVK